GRLGADTVAEDLRVSAHEQVVVAVEQDPRRGKQSPAPWWNGNLEEGAGRGIIPENLMVGLTRDVQAAVKEEQASGLIQHSWGGGDEGVDERPRRPVIAEDGGRVRAGDIQVAVGSEDQMPGARQAAAPGRDKHPEECPRGPVVAEHLVGWPVAD